MTELMDALELAGFAVVAWLLATAVEWVYRRNDPHPPLTPPVVDEPDRADHQPRRGALTSS
jgi:hypothetical protein